MKTIKFRQPIREKDGTFKEWFYWGFIDGDFITPALQSNGLDTRPESQQFTGLHDKNGNEIYGDDLMSKKGDTRYIYKVVYMEERCRFMLLLVRSPQGFSQLLALTSKTKKVVIGNVHQNPELL